MRKLIPPKVLKWPFFLGDILLLVAVISVFAQSRSPMSAGEVLVCVGGVALGAMLAILPFYLEYRTAAKLVEADSLTLAVSQIKNLEQLSAQIGYATSQWQIVRESADKTANASKDLVQRMGVELKGFEEFMQRSNDSEKATLRLEVDKLRRSEGEWLQVIVRMLDHTYALHQAALRSRQTTVAEQIGNFQNACREAARRIGLMPFAAGPDEPFDEQKHQLANGDAKPPAGADVEETVASGYTYQGKLLRHALVRVRTGNTEEAAQAASISNQPSATPEKS